MSNQATQIIFMPMVSEVLQRRQQQQQRSNLQSILCFFSVSIFGFLHFVSISQITCEFCTNFFLVQDLPHAKWLRTVCSAACDAASVVQMCKSLRVHVRLCVGACVQSWLSVVVVVVVFVAWVKLPTGLN